MPSLPISYDLVAQLVGYLREAAKPIFEADRHAKAQLKQQVRGVRPIERGLEKQEDEQSQAMHGYCLAVPSRAHR